MPNVNVYNQDGSLAGEIALNDAVFGIEVNTSAIHQVVVAHNAWRQDRALSRRCSAVKSAGAH